MSKNKQNKDNYALVRVSPKAKAQLDQLAATRGQSMRQVIDSLLESKPNLSAGSTRWINSKAKELGLTEQQVIEEVVRACCGQQIQDELNAYYIARRAAENESTGPVDDATLVSIGISLSRAEQ